MFCAGDCSSSKVASSSCVALDESAPASRLSVAAAVTLVTFESAAALVLVAAESVGVVALSVFSWSSNQEPIRRKSSVSSGLVWVFASSSSVFGSSMFLMSVEVAFHSTSCSCCRAFSASRSAAESRFQAATRLHLSAVSSKKSKRNSKT